MAKSLKSVPAKADLKIKSRSISSQAISSDLLEHAYYLMSCASQMAMTYDDNRKVCQYVHSTSRGHEAIQLAMAFNIKEQDYLYPYYRDESMLLGLGFSPYQLMLQLLGKADDPFSGGRSYYSHPNFRGSGFPTIPHQSSATGMQAIPATGAAQGIAYKERMNMTPKGLGAICVCSLGDGSVTEGEVAEAFQFAALKQLPIIYLVQDNDWGISVSSDEARSMNAYEYAAGFKGLERASIDGSNFIQAYYEVKKIVEWVRKNRKPFLLHAKVPLLGHHTSGVRKEWYRSEADLKKHAAQDPYPTLHNALLELGYKPADLKKIKDKALSAVKQDFDKAVEAANPPAGTAMDHIYAMTPIQEETDVRAPLGGRKVVMVDAALYAMDELLRKHPEALFYGQDVGRRLGGVFREAATLAEKYGDDRIFNTAIQEAYIVGSTAGVAATGLRPIVEIQFADYIWPSINQLVTELSKSCYLSMGKFPIASLIRIPIGAYGGGGPYHSGCIEASLMPINGIKVVYPSNAADMKGLLKAAFYDPNPVIMFEHKGLYWSKVPGTEEAKTIEPSDDYVIPLGKGRIALHANPEKIKNGNTLVIITYGMGVHWALNAALAFPERIEIVDLRTLKPLDEELIYERVSQHGKVILLTEEPVSNSFIEAIAGKIAANCFEQLDAPVKIMGSLNTSAIPLNVELEKEILPNVSKVEQAISELLSY